MLYRYNWKSFQQGTAMAWMAAVCLLSGTHAAAQSGHSTDSIALEKTMDTFLQAFRNLDWDRFSAYFAADATVFFPPSAKYPYRANNREEALRVFHDFFESIKKQQAGPPYLTIQPEKKKWQFFDDVAILSFELNDPGLLGRRTMIFQRREGNWKIVHVHASGVAPPVAGQPKQ